MKNFIFYQRFVGIAILTILTAMLIFNVQKMSTTMYASTENTEEFVELTTVAETTTFVETNITEKFEVKTEVYTLHETTSQVTTTKEAELTTNEAIPYVADYSNGYEIPNIKTSFKSWMPYTAITNKGSAAYKLQHTSAYTDENGLRKVEEDYCVAMGTYYSSNIGDRFLITMSTGNTFTVIISDVKGNTHTDAKHQYTTSNHCMMEFLVDRNALNPTIKNSGNVGSLPLFVGEFAKIEKIS